MSPRTLAELPAHASSIGGARVGIIAGESRHTFEALESASRSVARGLVSLGVAPRDRVAVLLPNCVEYVHLFFAVPLAAGVCVPINTFLASAEAAVVLSDSRAKVLVTTRRRFAGLFPHLPKLGDLERVVFVEGDGEGAPVDVPQRLAASGWAEISRAAGGTMPAPPEPGDVAVLTYTSGTTGRMKGVRLTHANLMANARSCLEAVRLRDTDRLLLFLPMFHSLTQLVCIVVPRLAALPVVLLPGVDRAAITAALKRHRPTIFIAVPAIYSAMAERPPGLLLRWMNPVRLYISGGSALPRDVMERFERGWHRPLCEGYGLSEAAPVVSLNPVEGQRRAGSVGLPLSGVEVRIARDDGSDAEADEVGEILVRGPNVMAGYHERPEETAQTLRDGWLHTGDLGRRDAAGYLFVAGRRKELLIFRGMNVYPREVEEVLASHPAVAEVAVIGLADPKRGDVPHAAVALRNGADASEQELKAFCRERLARYKVPRTILVMAALPRNATGKIVKEAVRDAIGSARGAALSPLEDSSLPGA